MAGGELVGESDLPDEAYLTTFFDTGTEPQQHSEADLYREVRRNHE